MNSSAQALHSVDWDFADARATTGIHSIHPYPAKFIPQIPRKLIQLFHPGDSSIVLDPFCGSGTTMVEAIDAGLDAWGIDVNPLACLVARVKTTPMRSDLVEASTRVVRVAKQQFAQSLVHVPPIPRVDHWFKHEVQEVLAALVDQINQQQELPVREALQVALSSIIVRVSNQESDTRYAAINKPVSADNVFADFEKATSNVSRAVSSVSDNLLRRVGQATVVNRNILTMAPRDLPVRIGLVVTSPPYPNAYEYWLYHKYRMYWLGMDPVAVRRYEIGARPHYFKKRHQTEHDFEEQMGICFKLLSRVMQQGAKACFLVGHSIIHGRIIDNAALLARAAEPHGFVLDATVERNIPLNRKTFNPAIGRINQEHVVVFSLGGGSAAS